MTAIGMACPRCNYEPVVDATCPRCGVVIAKYRPARPAVTRAPRPPAVRPAAGDSGRPAGLGWLLLGLGLAAALGVWVVRPKTPAAVAGADAPRPGSSATPTWRDIPAAVERPLQAQRDVRVAGSPAPVRTGLSREDAHALDEIATRLPHAVGEPDAARIEAVLARYPDQAHLRDLLALALYGLGTRDLQQRSFDRALARFERAATLAPRQAQPHVGRHDVFAAIQDWANAERAIRAALERTPGDTRALRALAYALVRQDRNREAADVLRRLLETVADPQARALLARIESTSGHEQGMTEQRLARFHVRYDGEAHEAVGREILRALERHYATLTVTLDHELTNVVPVILFSREAYYDASGAPAWSGGQYDRMDGRIRIPIRGLDAALTPGLDDTLIHELTHAFVHDRARGRAPRDVNEGLAQYLEGERVAEKLDAKRLAALAAGRVGGVPGFYLEALAFVEYLMKQRGQGGVNDLLRLMGERDDVDAAFQEVYGRDYAGMRKAWRERFSQEY